MRFSKRNKTADSGQSQVWYKDTTTRRLVAIAILTLFLGGLIVTAMIMGMNMFFPLLPMEHLQQPFVEYAF